MTAPKRPRPTKTMRDYAARQLLLAARFVLTDEHPDDGQQWAALHLRERAARIRKADVGRARVADARNAGLGCDWFGYSGEQGQCTSAPTTTVNGRALCVEHARALGRTK